MPGVGAAIAAFAASTVGGIVIGTAISVGLGYLQRMLAPKPERPVRQISFREAAAARRVVLGTVGRLGGIITDAHVHGATGEYMSVLYTLAGHEVSAINAVYFGSESVPLDGSGNATGKYLNHVHVDKALGTDDQARPTQMGTDDSAHWPATFRQRGCAFARVRMKFNPDLFPDGVPNVSFDMDGLKCYDPRSGTLAFTHNTALILAEVLTNPRFKGVRRYTHDDQQSEYAGDTGFTYVAALQELDLTWGRSTRGLPSGSSGQVLPIMPHWPQRR